MVRPSEWGWGPRVVARKIEHGALGTGSVEHKVEALKAELVDRVQQQVMYRPSTLMECVLLRQLVSEGRVGIGYVPSKYWHIAGSGAP